MSQRDDVLAGRIDLAFQDAEKACNALAALKVAPPTAGADQEEHMRFIESSLDNIQWRIRRLKEIGK